MENFLAVNDAAGMAMDLSGDSDEQVILRLKVLRHAVGYPVAAQFADSLDISPTAWNNYEKGIAKLPTRIAAAMHREHGVTLDWIYLGVTACMPFELLMRIRQVAETRHDLEEPPRKRASRQQRRQA